MTAASSLDPARRRVMGRLRGLWPPDLLLKPTVPYVGATTNLANLGDRALLESHSVAWEGCAFLGVPAGGRNRLLNVYVGLWGEPRLVVLGGGTLIGRPGYLRQLDAILGAAPSARVVCLGTGVEDPEDPKRSSPALLSDWATRLERFDYVGVRGPRSRDRLRSLGVDAHLTGDPALLLADTAQGTPPGVRRLGINVGAARPRDDSFVALTSFARAWVDRGGLVEVFSFAPYDDAICDILSRRAGSHLVHRVHERATEEALTAIRRCDAFIGHRLHASVLSVAAGVPTVVLGYQDKCWDFAESVGAVVVDEAGLVVEDFERGVEEAFAQRLLVGEMVRAAQKRLLAAVARIGIAP